MPILAAWLHDIDKIAIPLPWTTPENWGFFGGWHFPNYGIAWYGLSYLMGFIVGWLILRRVMTKGATPLGIPFVKDAATDLIMTCAMGVVIGGRLGYCVFYKPELFTEFTNHLPFWGVFGIADGGMASHGGMIGVMVGAWWWARKHKVPFLYIADLVAFAAPLGLFFGRIANFINGELYGRACDASYRFAVQFPQEVTDDWTRPGNVSGQEKYHALEAQIGPIPHELNLAAKKDPHLAEILRGVLTPRHPSQLYGAAAEGLFLFTVLFIIWRKPRKPGLIAGWFGIVYAFARVTDEFFRMPDAQFIQGEKLPLVTQGQLLSFFVFAAGIGLVIWSCRSKGKTLGGWGKWNASAAA